MRRITALRCVLGCIGVTLLLGACGGSEGAAGGEGSVEGRGMTEGSGTAEGSSTAEGKSAARENGTAEKNDSVWGSVPSPSEAAEDPEEVLMSCSGYLSEDCRYSVQIWKSGSQDCVTTFRVFDGEKTLQELVIPVGFDIMADTIGTPVTRTDVNGDGKEDFLLDYGISGQISLGECFVYNEQGLYEVLEGYRDLSYSAFDDKTGLIYEMRHDEARLYEVNQYQASGNKLTLVASLTEYYDDDGFLYTEKRLVDGEMATIHENVPEGQIDLTEWKYH